MYSNRYSNELSKGTWTLPEKYSEMQNSEKSVVLRAAILNLVKAKGAVSRSAIAHEISIPNADTLSKALNYLVTTQQIYFDPSGGSRDPVFYPNGRLAHPRAQRVFEGTGRRYVLRAYDDYRKGTSITITEYSLTTLGESEPLGGIRLDADILEKFIEELKAEKEALRGN